MRERDSRQERELVKPCSLSLQSLGLLGVYYPGFDGHVLALSSAYSFVLCPLQPVLSKQETSICK